MGTGRVNGFRESTMGNGMSKRNEIERCLSSLPVNERLGQHRPGSWQSIVAVSITPVGMVMVQGSMWSTCSVVNTCSKEGAVGRGVRMLVEVEEKRETNRTDLNCCFKNST